MKNNIDIKELYKNAKQLLDQLVCTKNQKEEEFIEVINILELNNTFKIKEKNNYNLDEISNLFRFYENELKSSFFNEKEIFEIKFDCYILLIKVFTELCMIFTSSIEKRTYINTFFQLLEESKNILKFSIPLEKNHICIINNIIGEQLYYFTHIQYINIKDRDLDYILEKYHMNIEKQLNGYELSLSTNFGNNRQKDQNTEYTIFINNCSFLLLKMIYKLKYYRSNTKIFENPKFKKILLLFSEISIMHKTSIIKDIKEFKEALFIEFLSSANYLENNYNQDIIKEKVQLLLVDTDEYKQLIDTILLLKK